MSMADADGIERWVNRRLMLDKGGLERVRDGIIWQRAKNEQIKSNRMENTLTHRKETGHQE